MGPVVAADAPIADVLHRPSVLLVGPALVLAVLGLVTGLAPGLGEHLLSPYADQVPGESGYLVLWAGVTGALFTVGILAGGALLFWQRSAVEVWQARRPWPLDVDLVYRRSMRRLDGLAADVTGATQRGSLPLYLGTVMVVMVVAVGWTLLRGVPLPGLGDAAAVGLPRPGDRRRPGRGRGDPGRPVQAQAQGGAAGRGQRVRRRDPVPGARGARPRAHPGARRDHHAGGVRAGAAAPAAVLLGAAAGRQPLGADGGRRWRWA